MKEKKAEGLYIDFHGRDVAEELEITLDDMKVLTYLGTVNAIEYIAQKHDDQKKEVYRHVFKAKPMLLTNGRELVIYGHIKIGERGIEG